jgi:hypothetical protein
VRAKVNSRQKGARGERSFAAFVRNIWGVGAYRGRQYHGRDDAPDVVTDLDGLHFECKFTEKIQIHAAWLQAFTDSSPEQIPVVAFRRKRGEWMICIRASEAEPFAKRLLEGIRGGQDD